MKNNYTLSRYLRSFATIAQETEARFSSTARYLAAGLLFAMAPFAANAQINANYTFDTNLQGWTTSGNGTFSQTTIQACGGGSSARANVYYGSSNLFISPLLGIGNTDVVTMTFDYKIVEYEAQTQPTPASEVGMEIEWSNSLTGPWTNAYTMPAGTHVPSNSCATKTVTFTPTAGNIYVRIKSISIGDDADTYFYYDNISFSQGAPPTCFAPSAITVGTTGLSQTGFTISFTPPTAVPAEGYLYEVRSSGAAGSGSTGLAASGSATSSATTAVVTGLTPSSTYIVYMRSKCSASDLSAWAYSSSVNTLCGVADIPYVLPLESAAVPALPNCVAMENVNGDSSFWKTSSGTPGITGKTMVYAYNYAAAANDWFYTPGLNLTAGTVYRISFKYRATSYEEKLKVAIGSSATSTAMTTTLLDLTIPASNSTATLQTIDFTVATAGVYNIGFQAHSDANKNSLHIGEASIILGPSCLPPTNVLVSNIDKNTATISWTASSTVPANGYAYEIRTSGAAGSGSTGLAASGATAAGILTAELSGLSSSTQYSVYVSANCAAADQSVWSDATSLKTLCDYLEIAPVNDTTCVGSTATLQVTGATTEVKWYATSTSSEVLATGPTFETPVLTADATYFANASSVAQNEEVQVGAGTSTSNSYQNPFYSLWSNTHTQHILLASELNAAGLFAGPINSVGITLTDAGSLPMLDFSLKIGTTTATSVTDFADNSAFSTVYTSASLMPVNGLNMMQFTTPFQWDGTSNIILEFCHGNPTSSATMNRIALSDPTTYNSSIKTHLSASTAGSAICGNTASQKTSYMVRPVFTFLGSVACENPVRTAVTATVNPVPEVVGNHTQVINVDAAEDATVADLEPLVANISWFATEADAIAFTNVLELSVQLVSGATYYAVVTENDCRSLPFDVTVTVALGVASQTMNGLSYYPNPVQNQLNINYSENITSISVFNLVGQKVMNVKPNSTNVVLDMSTLAAGTYMIQVNADAASKVIKLIKR